MNLPDDELARRVVKALNRGVESLDAGTRERLAAARKSALSRHRERPEPVWGLAWAMNAASPGNAYRQYGARYLLVAGAFVLAMAGFAYWHATAPNDFAEIDVNLLTDDLPINAYLDSGFDSWLKRSPR
ncbi:MAG TPA: DUF3619 family protein [Burkholderiales bacterium]|jgi:hypothetical protein|nr:DUF3619 family protein [Burkholderiales bacterium]